MNDEATNRTVLVDASAYIRLARVGVADLLPTVAGRCSVPDTVAAEISDPPATDSLEMALEAGEIRLIEADAASVDIATGHLDRSGQVSPADPPGDVALLACAIAASDPVVVTDDRPLRQTCRALSIPISGSIGVLVRAVEIGELDPATAREHLYAMDEVGARLSASLVREAERLIDQAARD